MTTITFGSPTTPTTASVAPTPNTSALIPTLKWSSPWKHNVLHGLDRLHDPTYGLPATTPSCASTITTLTSKFTSTTSAIAHRVAFAIHLLETATATGLRTITLVGAGHIAQAIRARLPPSPALRQTSRLPPLACAPSLASSRPPAVNDDGRFTCDMSAALAGTDLAILSVPPHALAPLIELHAHAMQDAKLILVVCAGVAPLVVRRMFLGRGLPAVAQRVVVIGPDQDPLGQVAGCVLGAVVGVDVYPAKGKIKSVSTAMTVREEQAREGAQDAAPARPGQDEEEARREWPGLVASQTARALLQNVVRASIDEYDPPQIESKSDWMKELETTAVQDAIRKVFVSKIEGKVEK